ncbi:unnamed protein product [Musa acuminata subsp. burmannicoides]
MSCKDLILGFRIVSTLARRSLGSLCKSFMTSGSLQPLCLKNSMEGLELESSLSQMRTLALFAASFEESSHDSRGSTNVKLDPLFELCSSAVEKLNRLQS